MKIQDIPSQRLLRQRIAGSGLKSPADVVRWMGAVQAQDYSAAKWAVGMRTGGCTDADVEAAFAAGEILRTHVMRPTWHFVMPEDLRWMQALTAPRVKTLMAYQQRRAGVDPALLKRTNAVLVKALRDGAQMTRTELTAIFARAGIQAAGLRVAHILSYAELDGIICSGARKGKQFTYALVEARAPTQRQLDRDESLASLTERYFTSHGPATLQDLGWWSGLASADVKRGVEMVKSKLVFEELDGRGYWMTETAPAARFPRGAAHLLPNYDEYVVGYTDRSAIFDDVHARPLDARRNPLFNHTIVSRGRIIGTWKRSAGKRPLRIEPKTFVQMTGPEAAAFRRAADRLLRFLES